MSRDLDWKDTAGAQPELNEKKAKKLAAPKRKRRGKPEPELELSAPVQEAPVQDEALQAAEQEQMAKEAVEDLMRDLFGKGEGGTKPPEAEPDAQTGPTGEAPVVDAAPSAAPEAEPPPAPREEERAAPVFREEKSRGEKQTDLFSVFSVGMLRRRRGMRLNPSVKTATEAERELKRSVESSEEDFKLLLDLDYEDELGKAIGFDKIRDYHENDVNGRQVELPKRHKGGDRREYEAQGQDITLRKGYAKRKKGHIIHLAVAVVIMLLLFVYEQPRLMASLFHGPLDGEKYPVSYILIGIQLLILTASFSYRRLREGLVRLIHLSPIDSSFCSVMLLVTFVYHVVMLFVPHATYPAIYLSPAAGSLALLALADLLDWYRESLAFQVASSRKAKYALVPRVSVGGRQNNARERLMEAEQGETMWYVSPVGFVRNYFANTEKRARHQLWLGSQLILIVAIGLALGLFVLATGGSAESMWQTVFVTFLLSVPAISLLVTSLPMFWAALLRLKKRAAIIGEETVYNSGGKTVLVMPDADSFGGMQRERFELIEDCDIQRTTVLLRALLDKVQSPLAASIDVEYEDIEITITDIDEHGIAALAGEEKISMIFGNVEYLQKYGIRVQPRGADLDDICRRLLCVAVDRKVSALFLSQYRFTDAMQRLLRELEEEDVRVMIRSKDPGVHDDMLARLCVERKEPVHVMKPAAREVDIRTDRVDATVVAIGSATEAARAFAVCRRVRRAGNFGRLLQGVSVAVGVLLSAALAVFGFIGKLSPFVVTLYMLLWCGVHALVSYLKLRVPDEE